MTQLPKTVREIDETDTAEPDPTWEADQKTRGYYYDDACGYETYDPEKEADEVPPDVEK